MSITWDEDGSASEVAADYVRPLGAGDAAEEEVVEERVGKARAAAPAVALDPTDMDALLAAAEAAGAMSEADSFVEGNQPPSAMHWAKALTEKVGNRDTDEDERKRCRPLGLMTSAMAKEMVMAAKKARTGVA
uniref:Uncharacterized protein n=1 Tax=Spumella elongata TaxID=89044 RepID=A0A7S3MCL0_9STRA